VSGADSRRARRSGNLNEMKPNFALTLSFDGIGLLHRAATGWHLVGEVALDTADLAADLSVLRRTAVQLDSAGLRSKLVIPNEQIRYLNLPAPAKDVDIVAHVTAALDGATPYDVADLRFDWIIVGTDLHIAAVAIETLNEAEDFAEEHGFGPVSFVATPDTEGFPGEPFFGPAKAAARLIDPSDRLMRDTHAIRILGRAVLPVTPDIVVADAPPALPVDTAPAAAPDPAPSVDQSVLDEPDVPSPVDQGERPNVPDSPAQTPPPVTAESVFDAAPDAAPDSAPDLEPDKAATTSTVTDGQADDADSDIPVPLPGFSSRRTNTDAQRSEPAAPRRQIVAELPPLPDSSPPILSTARTTGPTLSSDSAVPEKGASLAGVGATRKAPAPATAAIMATAPAGETVPQPAAFRSPPAAPSQKPAASTGLVAPLLARLAGRTSVSPDTAAHGRHATPAVTQSEKQRLTIFGARKPEPAMAMTRGRPRFLALILTGILLIFMAAVAAWSAMVSDTGFIKGLFGPSDTQFASQMPLDDLDDPATAPDQSGVDLVRLDSSDTLRDLTDEELAPEVVDVTPAPLLPETAEQTSAEPTDAPDNVVPSYAASGIWQIAPSQPDAPPAQNIDDVYLASIDTRLENFDAVALPAGPAISADTLPLAQSNPAPLGTQFDMDARGLVRATPEGAQTPDGITVFAGRPPVTPTGMPTRFERTPTAEAEPAPATALAAIRPNPRPETLVENNERAQLGGLSRNELAGVRPRQRPATLAAVVQAMQQADVAEAEEDEAEVAAIETATAQAIATSLKPLARPRNFASTVDSTRQTQQAPQQAPQQTQQAPQQVAAATLAPQRNAAPQIPSTASVAQQATVRGAINLRQVNLIGVYGQPSNRRALVRLSNGRYQKVQVGDRLDGGQVRAIGESELSYVKNNRAIVLTMPRG